MSSRSSSVRTAVSSKSELSGRSATAPVTKSPGPPKNDVDPDVARLNIPRSAIKELQALVDTPREPVRDRGNTAPRDRLFASLLSLATVALAAQLLAACGPSCPGIVGVLSFGMACFLGLWNQVHGRALSRQRIALFNERNFLDTYQVFDREFGHLFQPEPNTPGGCCGPAPPPGESPVLTVGRELIEDQQKNQFQDAVTQHYGGMYANVKRVQSEMALLDRANRANSDSSIRDPAVQLEPADIPLPGATTPLMKQDNAKTQ